MRRLRLLVDLTDAAGIIPAGTEIVVEDAEARTLRGAIGLVEDLGVAPEARDPGPAKLAEASAPPSPTGAEGAEGGGDTLPAATSSKPARKRG
jgi:hypothetical protein